MVCNIRNYWVSGLYPSSGILNTRKHNEDPVSETLCFLVFLELRTMDEVQNPSNSDFYVQEKCVVPVS
jgi:hypothetical protein